MFELDNQYFDSALVQSFLAIMATEIGDKTFLIAAIMSMKNPRLIIFAGAMSALGLMTVLSAYLGHVFTAIISKKYTQLLAAILFFVFGVRMLKEAYDMAPDSAQEELQEVQAELLAQHSTEDIEAQTTKEVPYANIKNLLIFLFSPIFVEISVITFLAEWGDRSQIASTATSTHA
jgi:putative Ca2+/H+ antiporter (TMEM165/GDT1 family)